MPGWILEYGGFAVGTNRGTNPMVPQEPALAITQFSSGGSSGTPLTIQFSSATNLIAVVAQVNMFGSFGSSAYSSTAGSTISSTNAVPFLGGSTTYRGVKPSSKVLAFST